MCPSTGKTKLTEAQWGRWKRGQKEAIPSPCLMGGTCYAIPVVEGCQHKCGLCTMRQPYQLTSFLVPPWNKLLATTKQKNLHNAYVASSTVRVGSAIEEWLTWILWALSGMEEILHRAGAPPVPSDFARSIPKGQNRSTQEAGQLGFVHLLRTVRKMLPSQ